MGNVKWDVRSGAKYWKREMGSEDCECLHPTSHMASEKWGVGLKRGFPFLKYSTQERIFPKKNFTVHVRFTVHIWKK